MPDESAALCPRSDGTGSTSRYGKYGYLYVLSPAFQINEIRLPPVVKKPERTDQEMDAIWRPRVQRWRQYGQDEIGRLALILGVDVEALQELHVGHDGKSWTVPERNEAGLIVGVSRRFEDGTKRCAVGSRRGLTYSDGWQDAKGPVLIVEGASDVAAGLTLGLSVIGRPNNIGGLRMLVKLLRDIQRKLVVIAERDKKPDGRWPGMEGAKSIAAGLRAALHRNVSVRLLPDEAKDLRDFLNSSGTGPTKNLARMLS